MQNNEPLITALYERLSRDDDQQGDSNSIVNQKSYLTAYAADHGFTHCRHYTDDGYSGGSFERPGWKQLIADIDAGLVETVIAKDLSRIGRDYIQTGFYTEVYFRRKGVRFIAIGNGVDTVNPISSEFAPFMNVLNEMYLRDQSKKMRTFFRQRGNSGKPTNTLCVYGYKKDPADKNHWLVDDEAAAVVRRIYRLAIDCHGPYEIANILSSEHVECPAYYNATRDTCMKRSNTDMSKPYAWNGVTVSNILKRPEYMGHTVNFRSSKNGLKAKRQAKPQEEWMIFQNTHEPIIPEDEWQLAQCVLSVRRRTDSTGTANPLTGKLYCAECGAKLNNHRSRAKQSGRESDDYYDCPTYSQSNPDSTEFAGILNIMNDWYLRDMSRKIRSAAQQKGKSGKPLTTHPCFGYVKDPKDKSHWLVDPEAADTVRRIFELAASGMSQLKICRTMVQEHRVRPGYYRAQREPDGFGKRYATNHPYHWERKMVYKIVQRQEYLGNTVNFKTCHPEYRSKQMKVPLEDQLVFVDTYEAIVNADTWQAAQRIIHPEMSNKPGTPCILNGLMVCGECGVPMLLHRVAGGEECSDFVCRTHKKSEAYAQRLCTHNSIRVPVVREIIRDTLRTVNRFAIADEEGFRRRLAQKAASCQPDDRKQLAKQIREKEKHIARLEHLLQKLYEDYALGHIPEERFDKLAAQYEQEEAVLKTNLATEQARLNDVQAASAQTDQYLVLAHKYRDCTELTDDMIRAFVEKIVVHKTIRPAKGQRTRQIDVHLNYIGQFPIPAEGMENEK